ncbi:hypothetical protein G6O69_16000 [Pseudenhygromyxa sp. WMMC2535]|uniref:hypothetical protein n=1 Tax=Pseudenhygromyxa sp. WMMC2535 TaxID=2712867 RepID=UPI001556C1A2|nr:hypothetical protein [Pseudenhygromyxa sp. WMMC2535]NVB39346.1 hypothetical protein [Pseudenhygromyxa sp. WMMC2535]
MRPALVSACALAWLVACTKPEPEPTPSAKPSKRRGAGSLKLRAEPEPAPEPAQPVERVEAPLPAQPAGQWWCLCYQREGAEGPEPMTACREDREQCRKLEGRVAKGSKEIIAGSLTQSCLQISGNHPSDAAGTHDQWQPSALAGSWASEGVCQLSGLVRGSDPAPTQPEDAPEEPPDFQLDFLRSELIGDFALGQGTAKVRHALGKPETKSAIVEEAATGEWVQTWTYPEGLSFMMSADTEGGPQTISTISIEAPSKLKTRRGIGIGARREAVERAYGDVRNPEEEFGEDDFVAGSIYGGLMFHFEGDAVESVFLGAAAE